VWSVGIHYRLPGATTFSFANAYGRLYVDNVAPLIGLDAAVPTLTNTPQITIRGAVGDTGMWSFGEVGGAVFVNGQRADLYPRNPPVIFTGNNNELAFEITLTLNEGANPITIFAQDAAGNRSPTTLTYSIVLDTIPPAITFSGARTYTVDEHVTVTCTASDSGSGVVSTTCGGAPLLDSDAWRLPLGPTTVSATATDHAGNTTTASASATVVVTHSSLITLASRFAGDRLGKSLVAQLAASQAAAARGNTDAANRTLAAFQNEVRAQAGKSLAPEHADVLLHLSAALSR
jgi:hypothetical protein